VITILAGCVGAVILAAAFWPGEREPEYNGKKLSEWLEFYEQNDSVNPTMEVNAAADAVKHIGTNAVPWLVKWIDYDRSLRRNKLYAMIEKLPGAIRYSAILRHLVKRSERRTFERFQAAGAGFRILGPQASPAIPDLIRLMDKPKGPAYALSCIGRDGLPALLAALSNAQQPDRDTIVWVIGSMRDLGTNATPCVPVLIRCLDDKDRNVGNEAAIALGNLRLEPTLVVPVLTRRLQGTSRLKRSFLAHALGQYGEEARSAVDVLLDALNDSDLQVCEEATNALRQIAPEVLEKSGARTNWNFRHEN